MFVPCFVVHCFVSFLVLQCDYYLDGEDIAGCFTLFVFLMSCDFNVALPHGAVSWSSVCDCGIF